MKQISFKDKKAIFARLEKMAKKANMTPEERWQYEEEWKNYNDYFNTLASAKKQGVEEGFIEGEVKGREEEKRNNARKMKAMNFSSEIISQITGLSVEEIEKL